MVLIDTSVWVDFFNGVSRAETDELDRLLGTGRILMGDLILAEILQGFARDADYRRARSLLLELPYADLAGREIAIGASNNNRRLRRLGFTVRKTIDVIIGTFCMANDHELLHSDRDFDCMELSLGLRIHRHSR
ncbi:MAG: type II toxin-antitoxin system VapC family toxin [Steroidobacteraceae bacterium]